MTAASTPDRSASDADVRLLFGLLSLLLALSLVLHQLWWEGFELWSWHFVVIVAALWAAARPTSVRRFVAMVGAEVVSVAIDMPGVGSHTLLLGVCGAAVLAYTTEAGYWNHAFIPEGVRVFRFQDQLVRVTASNDPTLLRRSRNGTRLVRFELERYLRLNPGATARTTPATPAPSTDPGLVDRVAKVRDVRAQGRTGC